MSIPIAYFAVIGIWATTPLAVLLSTDSMTPIAAVLMRMLLALCIAAALATLLRHQSMQWRNNWKLYAAASIGIFPNMPLVYWAAQSIPSGLISVLFALSPFFVAALSYGLGLGKGIGLRQCICLLIALIGLMLICYEQLRIELGSWLGVVLMLVSALCFVSSNMLIKQYGASRQASPLNQLIGSLTFALPSLLLTWFYVDGELPKLSRTSLSAIVYLALIGSVIGFMAYFYLLSHLSVMSVSLIPLLTPALALMIGALFNQEQITITMILGTAMIISALALFNDVLVKRLLAWRPRGALLELIRA